MREEIACTSVADSPGGDVAVGIRPHKIAQGSRFGDFLYSADAGDVVEQGQAGRQASVHAHNLI